MLALARGAGAAALIAGALISPAIASGDAAGTYSADSELVVGGTAHQVLFDIDADGGQLFAVGAGGRVLRSTDAGSTWLPENTGTHASLLGVSTAGRHTVAVGQMGLILVRDGSGAWTSVKSGTKERLFDVSINSQGYGVAVGAFGALLRTEDGGQSWLAAAPEFKGVFRDGAGRLGDFFTPNLYGVQVNEEGRVWVVGELALAMRSPDGGKSWQITHAGGNDDTGIDPTLSGVYVNQRGGGFAVGQEGFVLKTVNSGKTWTTLARPTHANLLGVVASTDGTVVMTGMRDMQISRDHGRSFHPVYGNQIATGWYHGITAASTSGHALAVGVNGNILRVVN